MNATAATTDPMTAPAMTALVFDTFFAFCVTVVLGFAGETPVAAPVDVVAGDVDL